METPEFKHKEVTDFITFLPVAFGESEVRCTCGWGKKHRREGVLAKRAAVHMEKTNHKWAGRASDERRG